ncbi:MAG: adenosine-specific kinase [Candidatus Omnitrophica bacterium]|nr:adenosine-specific kinase [Candidatus Omnitrophota bacterium]MDD5653266.1 adenosine-specific kinase [Candidatus Omnitrophota bacterium]
MEFKAIKINKPEEVNLILGQSHFIKTVEDLYEVLVNNVPGIKFGLAFVESSGACKIRSEGTDSALQKLAQENALNIGAGHSFIILIGNAYPVNVLNAVKSVPEVCSIYCASANPVEVLVAESEMGKGIIGVIDGAKPKGVEDAQDKQWRHELLRKIGYKR